MRDMCEQVVVNARVQAGLEPISAEVHAEWAPRTLRRRLGREPTEDEIERALRPGEAP
jgi:hypothetical protein